MLKNPADAYVEQDVQQSALRPKWGARPADDRQTTQLVALEAQLAAGRPGQKWVVWGLILGDLVEQRSFPSEGKPFKHVSSSKNSPACQRIQCKHLEKIKRTST